MTCAPCFLRVAFQMNFDIACSNDLWERCDAFLWWSQWPEYAKAVCVDLTDHAGSQKLCSGTHCALTRLSSPYTGLAERKAYTACPLSHQLFFGLRPCKHLSGEVSCCSRVSVTSQHDGLFWLQYSGSSAIRVCTIDILIERPVKLRRLSHREHDLVMTAHGCTCEGFCWTLLAKWGSETSGLLGF